MQQHFSKHFLHKYLDVRTKKLEYIKRTCVRTAQWPLSSELFKRSQFFLNKNPVNPQKDSDFCPRQKSLDVLVIHLIPLPIPVWAPTDRQRPFLFLYTRCLMLGYMPFCKVFFSSGPGGVWSFGFEHCLGTALLLWAFFL